MLRLERHFALPGIAHRRLVSWMSPQLRVYVIDTAAIVFDTDVHRSSRMSLPRRAGQLTILFEGEYVHRYRGQRFPLRPADALLAPRIAWDERWEGPHVKLLVVEWGAPHGDEVHWPTTFRVDASTRVELCRLSDALLHDAAAGALLPRVIELARSLGAPLIPWSEAPPPCAPREVRLLHDTLSSMLTQPTPAPMWIDLERSLGMPSRTMRRWMDRHRSWFGTTSSFRSLISYWKLSSASMLLTAPAAHLADVARVTGYGSGRALLKALDDDGRPAPAAIRRLLTA